MQAGDGGSGSRGCTSEGVHVEFNDGTDGHSPLGPSGRVSL